jgi:hypothetical protein
MRLPAATTRADNGHIRNAGSLISRWSASATNGVSTFIISAQVSKRTIRNGWEGGVTIFIFCWLASSHPRSQ